MLLLIGMTKAKIPLFQGPRKSTDIPVTQTMLFHVRDELKTDISGVEVRLGAKISGLDNRITGLDNRITGLEAKMNSLETRLDGRITGFENKMDSKIAGLENKMDSYFHRLAMLIEEQNARNIYVLDGLTILFDRQERIENEFKELKSR